MKNLLVTLMLTTLTLLCIGIPKNVSACHYSTLTLNGGPTDIGGGLWSSNVTVCIGQKQNYGGTSNFTLCSDVPISSASGPNFPTVTNTYNICGGPCGPVTSVTATATGTIAGNCITYNTTSSTPAGYPLVPDRYDGGAGAAGNSNSFCFTITIVTVGYPATLALAGNVEADAGISGNDGTNTPCNGNPYDAGMTITFPVTLPIELIDFSVVNRDEVNHLSWVTVSEINNDYFIVENSVDGFIWNTIENVKGAGNSNTGIVYDINHERYKDTLNYYRLTQVDFDGRSETFNIIAIDNRTEPRVIRAKYDYMGQPIKVGHTGLVIIIYMDGTSEKVIKLEKY